MGNIYNESTGYKKNNNGRWERDPSKISPNQRVDSKSAFNPLSDFSYDPNSEASTPSPLNGGMKFDQDNMNISSFSKNGAYEERLKGAKSTMPVMKERVNSFVKYGSGDFKKFNSSETRMALEHTYLNSKESKNRWVGSSNKNIDKREVENMRNFFPFGKNTKNFPIRNVGSQIVSVTDDNKAIMVLSKNDNKFIPKEFRSKDGVYSQEEVIRAATFLSMTDEGNKVLDSVAQNFVEDSKQYDIDHAAPEPNNQPNQRPQQNQRSQQPFGAPNSGFGTPNNGFGAPIGNNNQQQSPFPGKKKDPNDLREHYEKFDKIFGYNEKKNTWEYGDKTEVNMNSEALFKQQSNFGKVSNTYWSEMGEYAKAKPNSGGFMSRIRGFFGR